MNFIRELGHRLKLVSADHNSFAYLIHCLSVAVQRGNAASVAVCACWVVRGAWSLRASLRHLDFLLLLFLFVCLFVIFFLFQYCFFLFVLFCFTIIITVLYCLLLLYCTT